MHPIPANPALLHPAPPDRALLQSTPKRDAHAHTAGLARSRFILCSRVRPTTIRRSAPRQSGTAGSTAAEGPPGGRGRGNRPSGVHRFAALFERSAVAADRRCAGRLAATGEAGADRRSAGLCRGLGRHAASAIRGRGNVHGAASADARADGGAGRRFAWNGRADRHRSDRCFSPGGESAGDRVPPRRGFRRNRPAGASDTPREKSVVGVEDGSGCLRHGRQGRAAGHLFREFARRPSRRPPGGFDGVPQGGRELGSAAAGAAARPGPVRDCGSHRRLGPRNAGCGRVLARGHGALAKEWC